MNRGIEVALVLLPSADRHHRIGRLIATTSDDDADGPWTGEATIHRDRRTGAIALGAVVLASRMPSELSESMRAALMGAWHNGGDVRILGPDRQPMTDVQASAALRAMATVPGNQPRARTYKR